MRRITGKIVFMTMAWLLTFHLAGAAAHAQSFLIFKDDKPAASIAIVAGDSPDMRIAVQRFRDIVQDGYGVDLPITTPGDGLNHLELAVEDCTFFTEDQTEIAFPSQSVMRITGGETGVIRTLFFLLEKHAGVRFLYQGVGGRHAARRVHYPQLDELAIPMQATTHDSAFRLGRGTFLTGKYFGVAGGGPEYRRYFWEWEAMLGAKAGVQMQHALGSEPARHRQGREDQGIIFPIDRYAQATAKPADEMFPILQGKRYLPYLQPRGRAWRAHWQPCFTSQAAEDEAVRNLLAYLDAHPETRSLSLSVNDNGGHCQCDACLAMDGDRTNFLNMPDRSTSYYRWVNAVVSRVAEKYPQVLFGLIAYREVINPPKEKLHPNVVVTITLDFQSTIDPQVKQAHQDLIRHWHKVASHLGVWAYDVGSWSWSLPRVYFQQHQEMIQFMHEHGVQMIFAEAAQYFTMPEGPRMYLYLKLLEDPYLDRQAVLMDWCNAAVGTQAARPLYDYFMFWENYWRHQAVKVDQFWERRTATYLQRGHYATYLLGLQPGDMAHARSLMQQMLELAQAHGSATQKYRAGLLMTCFQWFEAAAVASSAQWIDVDGRVPSAAAAVSLLQDIPQAVRAHQRWRQILTDTKAWIASTLILQKDTPGVVGFNMAAVFPLAHDEQVTRALAQLADDTSLPLHLRRLAVLLHDPASSPVQPVVADTFEGGTDHWQMTHAIYGQIASSQAIASQGSASLQCNIEHGNFTLARKLPPLNSQSDYLLTAKLYIQPSGAEDSQSGGNVAFWGTPLPVGWNLPRLELEPGRWHAIHAYIPRREDVDPDRLASELGGVSDSEQIKAMLTGRLNLQLRGFPQGSKVYLDDVRVYELSDRS